MVLAVAVLGSCVAATAALAEGDDNTRLTAWNAAAFYRAECAECHGAKGTPTAAGYERSAHIPDFSSECGQTRFTDNTARGFILGGCCGPEGTEIMPGFGDELTAEQVEAMVTYVRCLAPGYEGDCFSRGCQTRREGRPLECTSADPCGLIPRE